MPEHGLPPVGGGGRCRFVGMSTPPDPEAFPPVSRDDWVAAVTADLGPEGLSRKLCSRWEDGILLDALHTTAGPGSGVGEAVGRLIARSRFESPYPHQFSVRQRLHAATLARSALEEVLAGGADSVEVDLSGMHPEAAATQVESVAAEVAGAGRALALHALPTSIEERILGALAGRAVPFAVGIDPDVLGRHALAVGLSRDGRHVRTSGVAWFDAGATAGWSLALAVADGLAAVRALISRGVDATTAARQVELELALGADLFEGVAAVRAARLVWARGLEVAGADASTPLQVVVTVGERSMSRRDPWTNALRETAAAFAAAVGGADLVRLPAFDVRSGESAPARRLARNMPLILREEAGLARVADPAGGSWYLDAATGLLAARVWSMLDEIDGAGGLAAAIATGLVAQRIEAQRAARATAVRTRQRTITGVSEFPERLARLAGTTRHQPAPSTGGMVHADAEPFERVQDAADAWSETRGRRGRILLVRLGSVVESAPRVAFARGVVEVGAFEAVLSSEVTSPERAVAALAARDAVAAILCGTDARYATDAAPVAAALKGAGLELLVLAGRPGVDADALRAAGVDEFVFAGADIASVLERVLRVAGALR